MLGRSFGLKEEIIEFFRPDRGKVILALFYPYIFIFIAILIDPNLIDEFYGIGLEKALIASSPEIIGSFDIRLQLPQPWMRVLSGLP